MTAPLREVLVKAPGPAFGRAFDDPGGGLPATGRSRRARREHDGLVDTLTRLGIDRPHPRRRDRRSRPRLRVRSAARRRRRSHPASPGQAEPRRRARRARGVDAGPRHPDARAGSRRLARSRVATRSGSAPDLLCIGRTLRTNDAGARQLAGIVGGDVRIFDVPYWKGPAELVHLLSVDLAGRGRPGGRVPAAAARRACMRCSRTSGIRLVEVPEEEYPTLGCNVLAVRPGVVVVAEGNRVTRRRLEAAGVRGPRGPARRGRRERIGRGHLPDAPGAPRVKGTAPVRRGASGCCRRRRRGARGGAGRAGQDTERDGRRGHVQARLADRLEALGMAVEVFHPDPAAIREDPDMAGRGGGRARRCRSSSGGWAGPAASGWCSPATWTSSPPATRPPGRPTRGGRCP